MWPDARGTDRNRGKPRQIFDFRLSLACEVPESANCLTAEQWNQLSVAQQIHVHRLRNGLTLMVEPMMWLESAAFSLLVPAGCARDPEERLGLSSLTCEMAER